MIISFAGRRAAPCVFAISFLWVAACSPGTGSVSGTVTMDGKPVTDITISFVSDSGYIVSALADAEGRYAIDGAPVGPTKVSIQAQTVMDEPAQQSIKKMKGVAPKPSPSKSKVPINPRYGDTAKSGLGLTVKPGKNEYNITLTP
jgi:hypothetical protein